jgi:hypothetical protein
MDLKADKLQSCDLNWNGLKSGPEAGLCGGEH